MASTSLINYGLQSKQDLPFGFPILQGAKVEEFELNALETKELKFPAPCLINGTIRIENTQDLSIDSELDVQFVNFTNFTTSSYSLIAGSRYGVFFDDKPLTMIRFLNKTTNLTIKVYFQYLIKKYQPLYNEVTQFVTVLNPVNAPTNQSLYQGDNQRYNGTLDNATFLESVPIGTPMAIRAITVNSTSSSTVGIIEIPLASTLTYHVNIQPLGATNYTEVVTFTTDIITNALPSSATQSNATVQNITIDYLFDYSMTITNGKAYAITTTGSTTTITQSGYVLVYYFINSSLPINSAEISSISTSGGDWTITPTSGVTNSSGQVIYNISQPLTSTSNLNGSVSASALIAGISKNASDSIPLLFQFSSETELQSFGINTNDVVISSNETLTANLICRNLTVNSGITLDVSSYYIIASGTLNNYGTITQITNAPSGGSGGSPSGSNTSGGGAAGSAGQTGSSRKSLYFSKTLTQGNGGTGGYAGGSSSDGSGDGGAGGTGGNGGGIIEIYCNKLNNQGTISCSGGNGTNGGQGYTGSPVNGGGGGGGGGGAAGTILIGYYIISSLGTLSTSGGTAGSGGHGGNNIYGGNGGAGGTNSGGGGGGGGGADSTDNGGLGGTGGNGGSPNNGTGGVGGAGGTSTTNGGGGANGTNGTNAGVTYQLSITASEPFYATTYLNTTQTTPTPLPNQTVTFTGTNVTLSASSATTDSIGMAYVQITAYTCPSASISCSTTIATITQSSSVTIC
jgi:hypothetical protein